MRNLLLLMIIAICVYLYLHPKQEPAPPVEQAVAMAPQNGPRYYYHSPLEAPAMAPGVSTGMGYYSTDPNSRFSNYQYHSQVGGGRSAAGGATVYGGGYSSSTRVYYPSTGVSNLNNAPRYYGNGNAQGNGSYQGR